MAAAKGGDLFSLAAHTGFRVPNDNDAETTQLHYGIQAAYQVHERFTPFVAANAFTVLSEAAVSPLSYEAFDLANFGSTSAKNNTQAAIGFGFRSQLASNLDLGFAYEVGVTDGDDIFDDRFTVDLVFRF